MKEDKKSRLRRIWINTTLGIALLMTFTSGVFRVGNLLLSILQGHAPLPHDVFPVSVLINNSHGFVDKTGTVFLGDLTGQLLYGKPSSGMVLYSLFYTFALWASACYAILMMIKIVHSLSSGSPFVRENATRLRIIGLITLLVPTYLLISRDFIVRSLLDSVKFQDLELIPSGSGETLIILLVVGVFFLILSEVFRIGISLKDENELTV